MLGSLGIHVQRSCALESILHLDKRIQHDADQYKMFITMLFDIAILQISEQPNQQVVAESKVA